MAEARGFTKELVITYDLDVVTFCAESLLFVQELLFVQSRLGRRTRMWPPLNVFAVGPVSRCPWI